MAFLDSELSLSIKGLLILCALLIFVGFVSGLGALNHFWKEEKKNLRLYAKLLQKIDPTRVPEMPAELQEVFLEEPEPVNNSK